MLSHLALPAQVGCVPQRSIHAALHIFRPVQKAATLEIDYMAPLFYFSILPMHTTRLERPYLLSALTWLGF